MFLQQALACGKSLVYLLGYIKSVQRTIVHKNGYPALTHLFGQTLFYNHADDLGLVRFGNVEVYFNALVFLDDLYLVFP